MGNKNKNYTLKTKKPYASLTRGGGNLVRIRLRVIIALISQILREPQTSSLAPSQNL